MVLDLDNNSKNRELPYYMVYENDMYYISSYTTSNYTQLFSEYDTIYRNMSDYERMMRICKYLLPYFEKIPNEELIQNIRDCFISIEDDFNLSLEIKWGYVDDKNQVSFFPAFKFSDKLCLSLIYQHDGKIEYDDISDIINVGIDRLIQIYDFHKSDIEIINDDQYQLIIKIKF